MKLFERATKLQTDFDRSTKLEKCNDRETKLQNEYNRNTKVADLVDTQDKTNVLLDGYVILDTIVENAGEASIYHVQRDGVDYALKWYNRGIQPKQELVDLLCKEHHPNVMKIYEYGTANGHFYELQPYYIKGDLGHISPIEERVLEKTIIPQINEGLNALHSHGIIHRDIKPSNLYLDDNSVIIGDFGISSELDDEVSVRATTMSRTLGYAAPESATGFISKETDYYSLGVTLLHLYTGIDPFKNMTDMQILYQTINEQLVLPSTMPERLQLLIRGLTCKDRKERWGYEEIKKWCNKERVFVSKDTSVLVASKPYVFSYNKYSTLSSLSIAFANNWTNAKKHLSRGLIEKYLVEFGEELANECITLRENPDKDAALFQLILLMNPNAPIAFKGITFAGLEQLGITMAEAWPGIIPEVEELLSKGLLLKYLENGGYDSDLKNRLSQIMTYGEKDNRAAYFALMSLINAKVPYKYGAMEVLSLDRLVAELEALDDRTRETACSHIIQDQMFFGWILGKGYYEQLTAWLAIYENVRI